MNPRSVIVTALMAPVVVVVQAFYLCREYVKQFLLGKGS